jgi:hypothetical protein
MAREGENHRGISKLCGPFPEAHRTKEGSKSGQLNGIELVPWDGRGLAKRLSIDERMT